MDFRFSHDIAKKKMFAVFVGLILMLIVTGIYFVKSPQELVQTPESKTDWVESSSKGALTSKRSYFAVSKRIAPTRQLDFPYNEITASVGFGCNKENEWMYVALSEPPNIANVKAEDDFHAFEAKIKFDDEVSQYEMTKKFGDRFLHFREDYQILTKLAGATAMLFELDWHKEGLVRFNFSLSGSTEVIDSARNKCSQP